MDHDVEAKQSFGTPEQVKEQLSTGNGVVNSGLEKETAIEVAEPDSKAESDDKKGGGYASYVVSCVPSSTFTYQRPVDRFHKEVMEVCDSPRCCVADMWRCRRMWRWFGTWS